MFAEKLKKLHLDEKDKIGYTFKTLGAGFWALRQNDFRQAITDITMEVRHCKMHSYTKLHDEMKHLLNKNVTHSVRAVAVFLRASGW